MKSRTSHFPLAGSEPILEAGDERAQSAAREGARRAPPRAHATAQHRRRLLLVSLLAAPAARRGRRPAAGTAGGVSAALPGTVPRHVRRTRPLRRRRRRRDDRAEPAGHAQRALGRAARRRCSPPSSAPATTTTVRCVVLASTHETVFSAGGNLGGLRRRRAARAQAPRRSSASRALFRLIGELGKPTICAANGHVLAGALGHRARLRPRRSPREARDVRHARDQRRRLPVHDHGADLPQRPAQEDERAAAARRADRRRTRPSGSGIVNRVVPADEFDAAVADWAAKLAAKSPRADAPRQGRDVPPAGHGVRRRARLPARASSRSRSPPRTSRRA